ncbi:hypothetical protein BGX38DRAFT_1267796 [Terfezia claveryi]|nr:hypothetical protein BGX38DRAFT_1267796 [Terfezia claveryi]
MSVKSLYACGSNLLGHIIPCNNNSNTGITDDLDELGHELITQPHRVFANVGDARVLYAGLADVLLELNPLSPKVPSSPTLYLRGSTPARLDPSIPLGGELTLPSFFPHIISYGFGTPTGEFLGVVLANHGGIWILNRKDSGLGWIGGAGVWWEAIPRVGREGEEDNVKGRMVDVSVSGNGDVAVVVEWGSEWQGRREVQDGMEQPKWYTLQIYSSLDVLFPTHPAFPPNSISIPHPTSASTYPLSPSHIPTSLCSTLTSHALLLQPNPTSTSPPHSPHSPLPHHPYPLILTIGDPRHPSLLLHSKDATTTSTTERELLPLAPLEGLQDLVRLEADPGGWEIAVLDGGGGVYLFGGRSGGEGVGVKDMVAEVQAQEEREDVILISSPTLLSSASEEREGKENEKEENVRIEVSHEEDDSGVKDVALGSSHLLVLLDSGEVFGIGRAEEGQLGCGRSREGRGREGWVKIEFEREREVKMEKVWAGAWASWMLVEEEKEFEG